MNKKRKGLLIILGIILLIVVGVFCYFKFFRLEPITDSEGTIVVERPEPMDDDPNSISCYDYIIQTMEAPEYWDESVWIPYSFYYEQAPERDLNAEAKEAFINGTGYRLKDINTATFERGYETKLTVNFSNNTAYNIEQEDFNWSTDDDYESPVYMFYSWDFNNHIYKNGLMKADGTEKKELTTDLTEYYKEDSPNTMMAGGSDPTSLIYWHKKSIQDYETKFASAGCPLLNKPEGTLESYKNIKAHPVEETVDDGLIHAPWEQEGFAWDYTQNKDIVWGTSLEDIYSIELPYSEPNMLSCINNKGEEFKAKEWNTLFAVLVKVNKETDLSYFDKTEDFENVNMMTGAYSNIIGALGTYLVSPALKELYGYNATVFIEGEKYLPEHIKLNDHAFGDSGTENWVRELCSFGRDENTNKAKYNLGGTMETGDAMDFMIMYRNLKNAYEYLNKEFPYADDYMHNFYLLYSQRYQRALGLR